MDNAILRIDSAKAILVSEKKGWIEHLFGVGLCLQYERRGDPDVCNCIITSSSSTALHGIHTAQKYIGALTELPESSVSVQDADVVNETAHYHEQLERILGCVILSSDDRTQLVIKGNIADVEIAEQLLESVHQWNCDGNSPELFPFQDAINHLILEAHAETSADNTQSSTSDNTDGSFINAHENELGSGGFSVSDIQSPLQGLSLAGGNYNQYNDHGSTSDEDSEQDIKSDPDYPGKVEFALKLGYLESDLVLALKHLGRTAGQNELLSEMIKYSARKDEDHTELATSNKIPVNVDEELIEDASLKSKLHVEDDDGSPFRHIIMDGSNIAMSHGSKEVFSCRGIQLAVDWFQEKGHSNITVFVPQWRKETSRSDTRIRDQHILGEMEREGIVVFTPSRRIGGKRVVCYDDRYILKLAVDTDGIVVSNDNYRDLMGESEKFKKVVEERLLMYSFVNDRFMPPDDPLGRNGPTLENFLLKQPAEPEPLPPPCPYGSKKCTYGNKCKYYHPERRSQPHKLVTEKLAEQAKQRMQEIRQKDMAQQSAGEKKKLAPGKTLLGRTRSHNPDTTRSHNLLDNSRSHTGNQDNTAQFSFSFGAQQKKETSDKSREYNQKLTESRMKMEQDRVNNELGRPGSGTLRIPEKKTLCRSKTSGDQPTGQSSQRIIEFRQEKDQQSHSPRGTSPVNLTVPPNSDAKADASHKFLSGHLLLAKKLSDEANESDKLKKKGVDQYGTNMMSPLAYSDGGKQTQSNQQSMKQSVQHSNDKKPLSCKTSAHESEGFTGHRSHLGLHASLSYDPRRLSSNCQPFIPGNGDDRQLLLQDFQKGQERVQGFYGPIKPPGRHSNLKVVAGHTSVSRMQSAPDTYPWSQPSVNEPPIMMRQNSSSDTQLNKILAGPVQAGVIPDALLPRSPGGHMSAVMQDTTGSVKFSIGGPPTPTSRKPTPNSSQMFSQDQLYQHRFPPEFVQPMPYNMSTQPTMPVMQQSHVPSNQQQQQAYPGNQQAPPPAMQQSHVPSNQQQQAYPSNQQAPPPAMSKVYPTAQGLHYGNQMSIWDPNQPGTQSQYTTSNMWPSMVPPNMNPGDGMSTGPSQMDANPYESAILPTDSRYKLYCDLCRLFPEEKVRCVMNQHPEASTASEVCVYLVGAM